ncbi:hypothetical protein IMCC3088_2252 [Aequoribacter fuscus]|uniref:Uncharacterized protein n=1 Tax=Aequoribacter fuscus TaxID=2518989 RepID=F3L3R0_9GAMM|nr:hypothetical protein [Aequoribacter fuscus]EGG29033.1 hypothetical protein IMCC3088_2252 [Aequoribacter fuscus]
MHNCKNKKYRVAEFSVSDHGFINLSILHKFYDTRVYFRWQLFLEKNSKEAIYVTCDKPPNDNFDYSRLRVCSDKFKMFNLIKILKKLNKDYVIILHDPILLLLLPFLFFLGYKNFVFDSHEDVEKDILIKNYIPRFLRKFVSFVYMICLKSCRIFFKLKIISPSLCVCNKYDAQLVYNLPSQDILIDENQYINYKNRQKSFGYFGTLTKTRSIDLLIDVFKNRSEKLYLIGSINDDSIKHMVKNLPPNIIYVNDICLDEAKEYFDLFDVGFCIPKLSLIAHDALPVKIFEYYYMNKLIISSKIDVVKNFNIENVFFTELDSKSINTVIDEINNLDSAVFSIDNKNKYRFEEQLCVD